MSGCLIAQAYSVVYSKGYEILFLIVKPYRGKKKEEAFKIRVINKKHHFSSYFYV